MIFFKTLLDRSKGVAREVIVVFLVKEGSFEATVGVVFSRGVGIEGWRDWIRGS